LVLGRIVGDPLYFFLKLVDVPPPIRQVLDILTYVAVANLHDDLKAIILMVVERVDIPSAHHGAGSLMSLLIL
jgi:hypothetical protein